MGTERTGRPADREAEAGPVYLAAPEWAERRGPVGVGKVFAASDYVTFPAGDGHMGVDLDIDPRCDPDGNGAIEAAALDPFLQAFASR